VLTAVLLLAASLLADQEAPAATAEPLVGAWNCAGGPCIDPEIELAVENGRHVFRSWRDQRPSAIGRWASDGTLLAIVCCGGVVTNFRIVRVDEKELVLRGETDRRDARYARGRRQ
jgi:hypothetical protein